MILADGPRALVELCGISALERLLRTLQRCGITRATILSSTPEAISKSLAQASWPRARIDVRVCPQPDEPVVEQIVAHWPKADPFLLIVRGDAVFDIRLMRLLLAQKSGTALVDSSVPKQLEPLVTSVEKTTAGKWSGAALLQHDWASSQRGSLGKAVREGLEERSLAALDVAEQLFYDSTLRRKLRPFWFPIPAASDRGVAESVLLDSVQKGSLDLPAIVHAPLERFLVSHLCKTWITPHQLTIAWITLAFITTALFAKGYLICGIILAFIIGILDGLDGKQARLKVETSKNGKLEHRFDSLFEVGWPSALAYHFYTSGQLPNAFAYLVILVAAQALDGIAKGGIYLAFAKMKTPPNLLDRVVRLFGGRRNVYIWILLFAVILGAPAEALVVMAWLQAATAIIDLPHASWLLYRASREERLLQVSERPYIR